MKFLRTALIKLLIKILQIAVLRFQFRTASGIFNLVVTQNKLVPRKLEPGKNHADRINQNYLSKYSSAISMRHTGAPQCVISQPDNVSGANLLPFVFPWIKNL